MDIQTQTKDAIVNYLAASEPATLEELMKEVRIQCSVKRQHLLPTTITALASLMNEGKIQEYEQPPIDDPLEYAWELADDSAEGSSQDPDYLSDTWEPEDWQRD